MIFTFTLNPAIDKILKFNFPIKKRENNKIEEINYDVGGKATHVSIILSQLGVKNIAIGFLGSKNGAILKELLKSYGVSFFFIEQDDLTRVSTILIDNLNEGSIMITEKGFTIEEKSYQKMINYIEMNIEENDFAIFAGSPPPGISLKKYSYLIEIVKNKGGEVFVDTAGIYLEEALKQKPYLIKPNLSEFLELLKLTKFEEDKVDKYLEKIHLMGAKNIVLSLGKEGSILSTEEGNIFRIYAPKINEINDTVCGDSFVGGLISQLNEKKNLLDAVVFATAISASKATKKESSGFNSEETASLLAKIKVNKWR